jgi:hypothetical protein
MLSSPQTPLSKRKQAWQLPYRLSADMQAALSFGRNNPLSESSTLLKSP